MFRLKFARNPGLAMAILVCTAAIGPSSASNLVENGDFSAGNTGFTSDATFVPCCSLLAFGEYTIGDDPASVNGVWCGTGHTTRGDDLLIVDGISGGPTVAWRQMIDVTPGETYDFKAWVINLVCLQSLADPVIELRVDGATVAGPMVLPESPEQWVLMSGQFTPVLSTALLEIVSTSTAGNGNDFGIDDIVVTGPPVAPQVCGAFADAVAIGGGQREWGLGVDTDSTGNIYVAGEFATSPLTVGSTMLTSGGGADILVVKYDSSWNVLWARSAGGSASDQGRGIAVDASDHALVTGFHSSSSVDFGSNAIGNFGGADVFVVEYDASGNDLWALNAGGTSGSGDTADDVDTDASGNVYVGGQYWSSTFDAGNGVTLANGGRNETFVVQLDTGGVAQWAERGTGLGDDQAEGLAVDTDGNVYLTGPYGWQFQDASLNSTTFGTTTLTNQGKEDVFVVKYDSSGNFQWARSMNGPGRDFGRKVAIDADGNVYVTGFFQSSTLDLGGGNTLTNASAGDSIGDVYVTSYDTDGNLRWAIAAGGTADDGGQSIHVDESGRLFAAGTFISSSITFGTTTLNNAGTDEDGYVVELDPDNGAVLCAVGFGGTSREFASDLAAAGGNLYVTGFFNSPTLELGSTTLTNQGNFDLYVGRYLGVPGPASLSFGSSVTALNWLTVGGADSYNVYRGFISDLADGDLDGLPDAGYGACLTASDPDPSDTVFDDPSVPPAGDGYFYLVSVVGGGVDLGVGETSGGLTRVPFFPCPCP